MNISANNLNLSLDDGFLLTYVADLELEVDRLRKQYQVVQQAGGEAIQQIQRICSDATSPDDTSGPLPQVASALQQFADVLGDLYELPGYHPAHDQVVAIAVRPVIEQVFRWQQRLLSAPHAVLHLELSSEHIEWFPARFRHILDNLVSNALRYRDSEKGETRVSVSLKSLPEGYELRIADNGLGMPWDKRAEAFEFFYRTRPPRGSVGVGIAVVKLLVEQSGGSLTIDSGNGQGTCLLLILPRYTLTDHLG